MAIMRCCKCGYGMAMVHYIEQEEVQHSRGGPYYKTGRVRRAVSHLLCEYCGHQEAVDGSLDGPYYTPHDKQHA